MSSSGSRMSLDDARAVLGHAVAFTAHGGQWISGQLIGIAEQPQVIVRDADGHDHHFTLSTVEGWAASPGPFPSEREVTA